MKIMLDKLKKDLYNPYHRIKKATNKAQKRFKINENNA